MELGEPVEIQAKFRELTQLMLEHHALTVRWQIKATKYAHRCELAEEALKRISKDSYASEDLRTSGLTPAQFAAYALNTLPAVD